MNTDKFHIEATRGTATRFGVCSVSAGGRVVRFFATFGEGNEWMRANGASGRVFVEVA